ncbi:MAG: YggS family pyridoxal phosphate-dependent enzyme [Oscillospiraceae bacterium]
MQNQEEANARVKRIFYDIDNECQKTGIDQNKINVMAVTKTVPAEVVNGVLGCGITLIGENRVQELLEKVEQYNVKKDSIHFIGYLQTNKVKYIIDKVSVIESVHSVKLAKEVDIAAKNKNTLMEVFLEVNIGKQETKSGFYKEELQEALELIAQLENIKVKGLMCIPPKENTTYYFEEMQSLFNEVTAKKIKGTSLEYLSMGMSGDYMEAIKYGSNIIRLGSAIFGKRN